MEDGSDGLSSTALINNGEIKSVMANFPDIEVENNTEVNGKRTPELCIDESTDSSDCDALIIDESETSKKLNKPKKDNSGFRGFEKVNEYAAIKILKAHASRKFLKLNKSCNKEIKSAEKEAQNLNFKSDCDLIKGSDDVISKAVVKRNQPEKKKNSNPKLREYAQYLGLQPTVQFKCSKCLMTGFPSLPSLNEHLMHCTSRTPITPPVLSNSTTLSTNIRVTRRVFLCSACGTYYENWNLFLHLREVHKRFICLYCLGMFSNSEKLSSHLISKHNCNPSKIDSVADFFNIYKEPCFLMCCDCQKVFSESDNFFNHICGDSSKTDIKLKSIASNKAVKSNKDLNVEHVTGDLFDLEEEKKVPNKKTSEVMEDKIEDTIKIVDSFERFANSIVPMETNKETEIQLAADALNKVRASDDNGESVSENSDTQESSSFTVEERTDSIMDSTTDTLKEKLCNETVTDNIEKSPDNVDTKENEVVDKECSNFKASFNDELIDDEFLKGQGSVKSEVYDGDIGENLEETLDNLKKVPKVTLKLPKQITYNEDEKDFSDDSEKLTMELESETETSQTNADVFVSQEEQLEKNDLWQVAGIDIPVTELELEQPLDKFESRILLQKCLRATIPICIYCNHARKIAVNGKQLALHAIAEHRFSAIVNSITAEELIPESFVTRLKESFSELDSMFFNLESSEDAVTFSHIFECFQCRFTTTVHKELYLHNRKMHAKSILLCIMCKTNFYSYSELICHLCPGVYYDVNRDVAFRCCMCVGDELPSAFRLMVHLRKRHNACDVCLELCHNQSRLSNHVWKHKLHHLCYRCGIAYRNKPDITKHLFWKHGTESVLCKRCLQKKWPHVYHFCIPPSSFTCEECNLSFLKSVSLRVHKRIHTNEKPHACTFENCEEKFISKKLLAKHEFKHREPTDVVVKSETNEEEINPIKNEVEEKESDENNVNLETEKLEEKLEKPKPKVDVYDIPALNLSESDTSESEDESKAETKKTEVPNILQSPLLTESQDAEKPAEENEVDGDKPVPILENIWDDFKNYQAKTKEKNDTGVEDKQSESIDLVVNLDIIMRDHDYCITNKDDIVESKSEIDMSVDHDYCTQATIPPSSEPAENKKNSKKKKHSGSSSDSSSDSDSSSCTCGSNCSCSSTSGSSSSSSDSSDSDSSTSEGRRRQQARRERRKEKEKKKPKENETIDVVASENQVQSLEIPIKESDLETTESDTDEEFYDKHPQKMASKFIEEKRNQLMLLAGIGPCINGSILESSRPETPILAEEIKIRKKTKSKKRKKKKSSKYENEIQQNPIIPTTDYKYYSPVVAPLTLSIRNSPTSTPVFSSPIHNAASLNMSDADNSLRASKRRRVPNKFYGYSSDEEGDKVQQSSKWRKVDTPTPFSPLAVPPITIKTVQPPPPLVEPISIRSTSTPGELRVQQIRPQLVQPPPYRRPTQEQDSGTDSNESSADEKPTIKEQPALYCYCRCPYDEVSEMIGCDSSDCTIEWFHFECVGIMVPPKGQWFCPDCRKRKQMQRDLLQSQL